MGGGMGNEGENGGGGKLGKKWGHGDRNHHTIIFQAFFHIETLFYFFSPGNHFSKICLMDNLMLNVGHRQ